MVLRPLGFRTAAQLHALAPELAFPVHAVVGGVPGYAVDLLDMQLPDAPADVLQWLTTRVLHVSRPLVHEARSMLAVEPDLAQADIYHSVTTARASGPTRTSEIAARVGRGLDSVSHALTSLAELDLAAATDDPLRRRRRTWHVADPLLRLHGALVRPNLTLIERDEPERLADAIGETWRAQVLGPHLERLAREWTLVHVDVPGVEPFQKVGPTVVSDRANRTSHEVDVVAVDDDGRITAIGEAKLRPVDDDVARLAHVRSLLPDADDAKLLLFTASKGSTVTADAEVIDLDRLYGR